MSNCHTPVVVKVGVLVVVAVVVEVCACCCCYFVGSGDKLMKMMTIDLVNHHCSNSSSNDLIHLR